MRCPALTPLMPRSCGDDGCEHGELPTLRREGANTGRGVAGGWLPAAARAVRALSRDRTAPHVIATPATPRTVRSVREHRANVQAAAWVQDGVTLVLLTPTLLLLVMESAGCRHGAAATARLLATMGGNGGAGMTAERDLQGLTIGVPVLTLDGAKLGTVAAIQGRYFKVDVSMQPDYWLRGDAIRSIAGDQVTLGVDKERLDDYKVEAPPTA